MSVVDQAAALLAVGGVACVVVATFLGGRWRLGLRYAVDLWLEAGLLRLGGDPSLDRITAAAALVGARRLIGVGLRTGVGRPGGLSSHLGAGGGLSRRR